MDCQKTKERMSEYIDGMLRDKEASALKRHLDECAECTEVYRSTTVIIEHMQQMESIEEPVDFLEKVNTRLDKRFSLGGFFRRLFVPLRIKIPLEVAAAAAVIAVIVYLGGVKEPPQQQPYQITITESDERLLVDSDIELSEEIVIQSSEVTAGELEKSESDALGDGKPEIIESGAKKQGAAELQDSAPEESKSDKPVTDTAKSKGTETRGSAPVEYKSVKPVTDAPKTKGTDTPASAPAESEPDKTVIDPPKPATFGKMVEKSEVTELRAKQGPREETSLKETIQLLGGKVIETEYLEGTEKPKRMIVEIPAGNFESLIQELIRRGEIKAPPTEIKRKGNDLIRVELIFQHSHPPQ